MILAISRQCHCEFIRYRETMTQQLLIEFLGRLIDSYDRKIFLILDNLKVHHGKIVAEWISERKNQIELFFFPSYSPQLNPDEYLNNMLKKNIHSGELPHNKKQLKKDRRFYEQYFTSAEKNFKFVFARKAVFFIPILLINFCFFGRRSITPTTKNPKNVIK